MTAAPEAQKGPSAAAAETPPVVEMVDLYLTAEAVRIAIPIVAEAGIADLLLEGPRSVSALASATGLDADALGRLLRLLASLSIFAENGDGEYVNTRLSETLAAGAPMSMRDIAALALTPGWSGALEALPAAVREVGATAWDLANGTPIFEYLPAHPDEATVFQSAMTMFSGAEAAAVTDAYDFSGIGTLVDVGGSQGVLLASILRANPSMHGVLFDLPVMVEGAAELFAAAHGVADRATVVGGDFFESIPTGDAHILKHILHDWDDEHCVAILRSSRNATVEGGRLLVIEEALPPGNAPSPGKILDLFMLMVGGRERTQAEYGALFEQAGYELKRIIPTATPLHVIEATAR
jgi:O-methyltransferase domain